MQLTGNSVFASSESQFTGLTVYIAESNSSNSFSIPFRTIIGRTKLRQYLPKNKNYVNEKYFLYQAY